jgi:hypothetical protein
MKESRKGYEQGRPEDMEGEGIVEGGRDEQGKPEVREGGGIAEGGRDEQGKAEDGRNGNPEKFRTFRGHEIHGPLFDQVLLHFLHGDHERDVKFFFEVARGECEAGKLEAGPKMANVAEDVEEEGEGLLEGQPVGASDLDGELVGADGLGFTKAGGGS